MKQIILKNNFCLLVMAIVLLFSSKALASQQDIDVCVNGKYLSFENTKPFIQNERVLIPMRIIFEELGADVKWDGINKTIYATKDGINIIMQIENDNMIVNDKNIKLDAAPVIFNDTTMVPVRAVADCFCKIWVCAGARARYIRNTLF